MLADPHLRVCVEDFDPLGGDEEIDLSEGLSVSLRTLWREKGQTKNTDELVPSSPLTVIG